MEYFANIGKIKYEGKESTNPLSFKFYNPDEVIAGKTMREHLRFAMAYWHTMCAEGTDMFGAKMGLGRARFLGFINTNYSSYICKY